VYVCFSKISKENRQNPEVGAATVSLTVFLILHDLQLLLTSLFPSTPHPSRVPWKNSKRNFHPAMLCFLQWCLLPEESLTAATTSAMGLCYWSHSRWASVLWKDLPIVTPRTEGHGWIYMRGFTTRLHSPFYVPCCFEFFLCGQKGWRLAVLYRLPGT